MFCPAGGVEAAAAEFGAKQLPNVAVNTLGTPLLNSVLAEAEAATKAGVLVLAE